MDKELLYKKCVDFHGHSCGGLLIGFRAALCAMERFAITEPSPDEEIVCVAENDACGIDAVQALLGCTAGKGNLILRLRGKQAFTFFDRKSGKSLRLVLKPKPEGMTRQESFAYYQSCAPKDMFQVTEAKIQLPEKARIFDSYVCDCCGESTGANWIRLAGEKKLCLDCYETYNRFDV